jgi:hypothetical protein
VHPFVSGRGMGDSDTALGLVFLDCLLVSMIFLD